MNYQEVTSYLKERDMTMSRYEREDWDKFVKKIGLSLNVPFIHITGSNGKGSTAHYLYKIYQEAGYTVSIFSKPYFYKVNELMETNGKCISDADFARIFSLHENEIKAANLSSFEIETYIAFAYFNEIKPDLAIIEAGMGGATDSTTLDDDKPLLSIITSVSLEHTEFLGRTISEIALNKAGIVKENSPVLIGKLDEAAESVVSDVARELFSKLYKVDDFHNEVYEAPHYRFDYLPYKALQLLTPAAYQLKNASIAIEATNILQSKYKVDETSLRRGLESSPLPCRMERHHNIIIDGAHNPEAVEALMESVVPLASGKPIHVLFASFKDKNIAVELPRIDKDSAEIVLTSFDSPRARDELDYFLYEGDYRFEKDYKVVLNDYLVSYPNDVILVCGSLAFASLVRLYVVEELKL